MGWFQRLLVRDPVHRGRPLSAWLGDLGDPSDRSDALVALTEMGPQAEAALPELMHVLEAADYGAQRQAAEATVAIGAAAIPALTGGARHPIPQVRQWSIWALGLLTEMDRRAVPPLIDALTDAAPNVVDAAVAGLGALGPAAIPFLRPAFENSDWRASEAAAKAMVAVGRAAIPELLDMLVGESEQVRFQAAGVLGKFGPSAKSAIPLLIKSLRDPSDVVRGQAAAALGKIGSQAVLALIGALRQEDTRKWAAWALEKIGPEARTALPALVNEGLRDEDPEVRRWTVRVLAAIGPEASVAVSFLEKLLADRSAPVRCEAARALANIGPAARPAVKGLIATLSDAEPSVRAEAARALGRMAAAAAPATPLLAQLVRSDDAKCASEALVALAKIGVSEPTDRRAVIEALWSPAPVVRQAALDAVNALNLLAEAESVVAEVQGVPQALVAAIRGVLAKARQQPR